MIATDIAVKPAEISEAIQLGIRHHQLGQLARAQSIYHQVLGLQPDNVDALHLLGLIAHQSGDHREALDWFGRAIALNPSIPSFHNHSGEAWRCIGHPEKAVPCYRQAISLNPSLPQTYNNLGNALQQMGALDDALSEFRKALQLRPDFAEAYANLGNALLQKGEFTEALLCCRKAAELKPTSPDILHYLGVALRLCGNIQESIQVHRETLRLNPSFPEAHSQLLLSLHYPSNITPAEIFNEHLSWAARHTPSTPHRTHENSRDPDRPLRIGYVSPDFRKHVVATFLEPILKNHDRKNFEITCYFNHTHSDSVTREFRQLSDHWHAVSHLKDPELASLIQKDQIDILIDLAGHTPHHRLQTFALKPAPIQATWLGYPDTTGLSTIDYRITDEFADPPGMTEHLHSEKILRLPQTAWCWQPPRKARMLCRLPALGTGHITFGCFNQVNKITPATIALWAEILRSLPQSRMILNARHLEQPTFQDGLGKLFTAEGIDLRRIDFLSWESCHRMDVDPFHLVDIGLDTFPYHGTTTTCEMLWMGIPVIALAGATHASRVGVSLLTQAGLAELIASTPTDYIQKTLQLAGDTDRLDFIHTHLRKNMLASPLLQAETFTRNLESSYRKIWKDWCQA